MVANVGQGRSHTKKTVTTRSNRPRVRLQVEELETRTLLSALVPLPPQLTDPGPIADTGQTTIIRSPVQSQTIVIILPLDLPPPPPQLQGGDLSVGQDSSTTLLILKVTPAFVVLPPPAISSSDAFVTDTLASSKVMEGPITPPTTSLGANPADPTADNEVQTIAAILPPAPKQDAPGIVISPPSLSIRGALAAPSFPTIILTVPRPPVSGPYSFVTEIGNPSGGTDHAVEQPALSPISSPVESSSEQEDTGWFAPLMTPEESQSSLLTPPIEQPARVQVTEGSWQHACATVFNEEDQSLPMMDSSASHPNSVWENSPTVALAAVPVVLASVSAIASPRASRRKQTFVSSLLFIRSI
jgi:hypothetical protein